jgi:AraC-like DNA-binding protein
MNDRATGRLDRLTDQTIDPLWDVLGAVRMSGGVFLDAQFTAPWCVSATMQMSDFEPYMANTQQVVAYHYVISGRMQITTVDGGEPIEVNAGEAVLLSRNDGHVLGSELQPRPVHVKSLLQPGTGGGLAQIVHGGGDEPTHIFCGFLGSNQFRNPLFETLPPMLKIDLASAGSSEWMEASWRLAIAGLKQGRVGSGAVMSRLSELMFVEAVRNYAATLPPGQKGWLSGMRDPCVGKALAMMHGKPGYAWTAEELASAVAMSRTAFTDRFAALVGAPPMRYLTGWRMQLAQEKLRETTQSVAQIAYDVGYEAEEAFTRAFKRQFGMPPATWRKAN